VPADTIVMRVIFPVLEVVAVDNLGFSLICLYFPVIKVDLFQQLLLVEFQFTHC